MITITLDELAIHALRMVQAHRRAMYVLKGRASDREREEARSYAAEFANAVLALNPSLLVSNAECDRIMSLNGETE